MNTDYKEAIKVLKDVIEEHLSVFTPALRNEIALHLLGMRDTMQSYTFDPVFYLQVTWDSLSRDENVLHFINDITVRFRLLYVYKYTEGNIRAGTNLDHLIRHVAYSMYSVIDIDAIRENGEGVYAEDIATRSILDTGALETTFKRNHWFFVATLCLLHYNELLGTYHERK